LRDQNLKELKGEEKSSWYPGRSTGSTEGGYSHVAGPSPDQIDEVRATEGWENHRGDEKEKKEHWNRTKDIPGLYVHWRLFSRPVNVTQEQLSARKERQNDLLKKGGEEKWSKREA